MSDAHTLWQHISHLPIEVLTGASNLKNAIEHKTQWVHNNLAPLTVHVTRSSKKREFAAPNHILVDDWVRNIGQWEEAGGIGIHHTSAIETIEKLTKLGI